MSKLIFRGVFTDIKDNSNKFWEMRQNDNGSYYTQYGRVGDVGQTSIFNGNVESKIREKVRKGYTPQDMAKESSDYDNTGLHPDVVRICSLMLQGSKNWIKENLTGDISLTQISQVRELVKKLSTYRKPDDYPTELVEEFYRLYPTQVGRHADDRKFKATLHRKLGNIEETLNQMEHKLSVPSVNGKSITSAIAPDLYIDVMDRKGKHWELMLSLPTFDYSRVRQAYVVESKAERERFNGRKEPKDIQWKFHGSAIGNWPHILRSGLRMPIAPTNGSYYGKGIYSTSAFARACNYAHGGVLALCMVSLGNVKQIDRPVDWNKPPDGYHSVMGMGRQYDEFVIFRPEQISIFALLELK